jgi:hypothetical protein
MLWTIAVILLILWLLGFITANTFGGFIHCKGTKGQSLLEVKIQFSLFYYRAV